MSDITIERARGLKRTLEVSIMKDIKDFEERTGMRITAAKMEHFEDARFFSTRVYLVPISKKDRDNE